MASMQPVAPPQYRSRLRLGLAVVPAACLSLVAIIFGPHLLREVRTRQIAGPGVVVDYERPAPGETFIAPLLRQLPGLEHWGLTQVIIIHSDEANFRQLPGRIRLAGLIGAKLSVDLSRSARLSRDLARLERMPVTGLDLADQHLDEASWKSIGQISSLVTLSLDLSRFNNQGLTHLRRLTELQQISLDSSAIDDVGMNHLQSLASLKSLSISNTQVSEAAKERLTHVLPALQLSDD